MSAFLAANAALIAEAAQLGPNMTEAVKGGAGARLLPEGNGFLQLVEYIEYGTQPQEFQGVAKDPAPACSLAFAVSGNVPDPANPGQFLPLNNPDGTPYLLRLYPMAMSRNDKAKAYLLFKAMNWKGTATHFAQLLGQKFIGKIITYQSKTAGSKPRSIIDLKSILPPLDLMSGQPYAIPDAPDSYYRLFLWDKPTKAGWDALHIEGEYEAKDGKPAESKNFVQEEILGAVDFPGSALEQLLVSTGTAFSRPQPKAAPVAAAAPPAVAPAAPPAAIVAPAAPVAVPLAVAPPFDGGTAVAPVAAVTPPLAAPVSVAPAPVAVASVPVAAPVLVVAPAAVAPAMPGMPAMPSMPQAA